jgi:hypothetical protein
VDSLSPIAFGFLVDRRRLTSTNMVFKTRAGS